ncbi:MAG: outer membrane lipoprotein carrier protein LolA [Desulfomonilaceae bacterium]
MQLSIKRSCKACAAAVFLMPLLAACATKAPAVPAGLDSLIEGIERKAYIVNQFRAKFVKTRHSIVFNRDLSVQGNLVFQKPNRFRLTMSGDVNADILSDGRIITLIHDRSDQEVFRVEGERDLSKFADPLVLIMQRIGDGDLRKFAVVKNVHDGNSNILEVEPGNDTHFERITNVSLSFSDIGEIGKVVIAFRNGDRDETVFQSWALLARDDPEILKLNERLEDMAQRSAQSFPRNSAKHAFAEMKDANPANLLRVGISAE